MQKHIANFYFGKVDKNTVLKQIKNLKRNKTVRDTVVSVNILKNNADFFSEQICLQFNDAISGSKFPASFKFANITPVLKNRSRNEKDEYKSISILPTAEKIFEKFICLQLSNHLDNTLLKFRCCFRKGFGTQHCFLLLIEKWKKAIDNRKVFRAILTDMFKAFDCIYHDLLVAKLHAYELSFPALKLMQDYLRNLKQRTKYVLQYY